MSWDDMMSWDDIWRPSLNPYSWLRYIGYHHTHAGMKRKGRFGPLSNRKKNWGINKLGVHMARKHPVEFLTWKTKLRLGGR